MAARGERSGGRLTGPFSSAQLRLRGVRGLPRRRRCRIRAEREGPVRGAGYRGARPRPPPRQGRLQLQQPQ
ncbi:hypothetical protein Nmel_014833 [Mimus melanotis]